MADAAVPLRGRSKGKGLEGFLLSLPISLPWLGLWLAVVGVAVFVGSELLLGRHRVLALEPDPILAMRDARIAVVHILLTVYIPLATIGVRVATRTQLRALSGRFGSEELSEMVEQVGRSPAAARWVARGLGIGLLVGVTYLSTPREFWHYLWDFGVMDPEARWHRVLGMWVGWWVGEYTVSGVAEALRTSRSARHIGSLDLLDPTALEPYTRQALASLLASVGLGSIVSLFLFEGGYAPTVSLVWGITAVLGGLSMWLSLRGIHQRIREAKAAELERCRVGLRAARTALEAGRAPEPPLSEWVAWESRVQAVREWPFDAGALTRIGLYGLIPLISWSGGALVERVIDALLD
ncbi:MAG: hypothetical protein QNK05_05725 [Myxococcota bacterium]|nr:hypothetical protein [Myxococcota bacterium]